MAACGVKVDASGIIACGTSDWIGRYLCLVNDPDANEAVLAPFYGGSFNVLSASGQKVFAKGK